MCHARTLLEIVLLSFVVLHFANGDDFLISRTRRQAQQNGCTSDQFRCKSGDCISKDEECDGTVNCKDASDESNSCKRIKCPKYLFTCRYGACIDANLECDGKSDCRDASDENTPKCKNSTAGTCTRDEFRCNSGQCINDDLKCDGVPHCNDNSDEISSTCWNKKCPGYTYRCNYGACVDGTAECNGKLECFDGSDEEPSKCKGLEPVTPTPTPQTPTSHPVPGDKPGSCVLPEHPKAGSWSVVIGGSGSSPGQTVKTGSVISITCRKQHKFDGTKNVLCNNGTWSDPIGRCLKTCPNIYSTKTTKVTCQFNNNITENCVDVVDSTLAKFKCTNFYEDLAKKHIDICRDGSWDQTKPNCVPACGQKTVDATTLIVNGTTVAKGDYPWQTALYRDKDKELLCGGSLITPKVIVTAAHCITDSKGKLMPKENYLVALGKYYRQFDDARDKNDAQFSKIEQMLIPEGYRGDIQNYLADIAILVTVKTFVLSRRVQPVCLDLGGNYEKELYNPQKTTHGYVVGWGYTVENDKPSDVLKELKVPPVRQSTCDENLPDDYEAYLTHDKMCAGYFDQSTAVCRGDSGGGLVFRHDGRYYLTGVVSLSPQAPTAVGGCDSQQVGLYTRVASYIDFIYPKSLIT